MRVVPDGWRLITRASEVEVGGYYGIFGEKGGLPLPKQVLFVTRKVDGFRPYLVGRLWCYMGDGAREFPHQTLFLDVVGIAGDVNLRALGLNTYDVGLYRPPDSVDKMAKSLDGRGYQDVIAENSRG